MKARFVTLAGVALTVLDACLVEPRCFSSDDCAPPKICGTNGLCGYECVSDADCGVGLLCRAHRCQTLVEVSDAGPPVLSDASDGADAIVDARDEAGAADEPTGPACPSDMSDVGGSFCIDRFEASRPGATETFSGVDDSRAVSVRNVLPWQLGPADDENAVARAACLAAGKDLCTAEQWQIACQGPSRTTYGYGNDYELEACNGIDTFGRQAFHLLFTGALESCKSGWGAYDLNGNLWEHVLGGRVEEVRGGAFNCNDSATLHRCDYVPGNWAPTARGFRCCRPIP